MKREEVAKKLQGVAFETRKAQGVWITHCDAFGPNVQWTDDAPDKSLRHSANAVKHEIRAERFPPAPAPGPLGQNAISATLPERLRRLTACAAGCNGRCSECPDEVAREAAAAIERLLGEIARLSSKTLDDTESE